MKTIAIISASVRDGRKSHRAALHLQKLIEENGLAEVTMLDLKEYGFPLFDERLQFQENPSDKALDYAKKFIAADWIIIVSPVYNGSFPAAVKNVIDLLFKEWRHKSVAIASVSDGSAPGIATIQQLQTILLKMGALVAPVLYTVINVDKAFAEDGTPADKESADKYARPMVNELLWLMDKTGSL